MPPVDAPRDFAVTFVAMKKSQTKSETVIVRYTSTVRGIEPISKSLSTS
jgi:hypothetical protein